MKKFVNNLGLTAGFCMVALVIAVMLAPPQVLSQAVGQNGTLLSVISSASSKANPCLAAWSPMSSSVVNITTATSTELVPGVSGKVVYICGFRASVGAANTLTFESGTVTSCGSPVAKTGAIAFTGATNGPVSILETTNSMQSAASGDICVVTTTTGAVAGEVLWQQF